MVVSRQHDNTADYSPRSPAHSRSSYFKRSSLTNVIPLHNYNWHPPQTKKQINKTFSWLYSSGVENIRPNDENMKRTRSPAHLAQAGHRPTYTYCLPMRPVPMGARVRTKRKHLWTGEGRQWVCSLTLARTREWIQGVERREADDSGTVCWSGCWRARVAERESVCGLWLIHVRATCTNRW